MITKTSGRVAARVPKTRAEHLGPERRRPQVLDVALELAIEHGIGALTIGAVADNLGVTRPVVYSCFADRIELIEALVAREEDYLLNTALTALHSARGDDPEAVFVAGFQSLLRSVAERPNSWRIVFTASPDPAVAERFAAARATAADSSTRWIGPALKAWWDMPDLKRKLPLLVELFMSCCEAAVRCLLDESTTRTPDELGDFFGRAVFRAFEGA